MWSPTWPPASTPKGLRTVSHLPSPTWMSQITPRVFQITLSFGNCFESHYYYWNLGAQVMCQQLHVDVYIQVS